jgi:diaminopimelate decarboxylase
MVKNLKRVLIVDDEETLTWSMSRSLSKDKDKYEVIVANKASSPPESYYTLAGPICETGDLLAEDRHLPQIVAGDLIAILDTGAYGFAMSSHLTSGFRQWSPARVLD